MIESFYFMAIVMEVFPFEGKRIFFLVTDERKLEIENPFKRVQLIDRSIFPIFVRPSTSVLFAGNDIKECQTRGREQRCVNVTNICSSRKVRLKASPKSSLRFVLLQQFPLDRYLFSILSITHSHFIHQTFSNAK